MTTPSSSSKRRYRANCQATVLVVFLVLLTYFHMGYSYCQTQICNNPYWRRWNENTDKSHSRCIDTSIRSGLNQNDNDFTVTGSPNPSIKWLPPEDDPRIVPPLNQLVDVNVNRRAVVYEVTLSRESIMGIEIVQGKAGATVGAVVSGSKAQQLGILEGDLVVATSATAGDSLWTHDNAESIKSAINTRFVMSPTVKLRLERSLLDIDEEILAVLKVFFLALFLSKSSRTHTINTLSSTLSHTRCAEGALHFHREAEAAHRPARGGRPRQAGVRAVGQGGAERGPVAARGGGRPDRGHERLVGRPHVGGESKTQTDNHTVFNGGIGDVTDRICSIYYSHFSLLTISLYPTPR